MPEEIKKTEDTEETEKVEEKAENTEEVSETTEKNVDLLDILENLSERLKAVETALDEQKKKEEEKAERLKGFFAPVPKSAESKADGTPVTYEDIFVK